MRVTHELANFAAKTSFEDLPAEVVSAAKTVLIDGVANAVAGAREAGPQIMHDYLRGLGGKPQSSVINGSFRLPAGQAALANGVSLHSLDYEVQGYPSAHGTSSILPGIAAVAEREGSTGAAVLTAFVVGWDVQQRLRAAGIGGDMRGFHPPGIVGPLGAVAGVANLLGLATDTTAMAMGLAASRTGGLFGNNDTMTKATHPGHAARAGVESADLACLGLTSNPAILEAPRGYLAATLGGVFDEEQALDGLGSRFHLIDPGFSIKPFPAEIYMQWPLDAMTRLKARTGVTLDDVESIVVEPPAFRADLSRPQPASGLDGKFSYEYVVAAALVEDRVSIGTFTDAVRFSPDLQRALALVSLRENPEIPHDKATTWTRITVRTVGGEELVETCEKYEGAIGRPVRREIHEAKIRDCFDVGGLGRAVDRVVALVDSLERIGSFADVMALLTSD